MSRTTLRSKKGKKLYAKRDKAGKFTDIQTYKRAHGKDVKKGSVDEELKLLRKAAKELLEIVDRYIETGYSVEGLSAGERILLRWRKKYQ